MTSLKWRQISPLKSASMIIILITFGSFLTGCDNADLQSSASLIDSVSFDDKDDFMLVEIEKFSQSTTSNCWSDNDCVSYTPNFAPPSQATNSRPLRQNPQFGAFPMFNIEHTELDDLHQQLEQLDRLLRRMELLLEPKVETNPSYTHRINRFISRLFESEPQFADPTPQYFRADDALVSNSLASLQTY